MNVRDSIIAASSTFASVAYCLPHEAARSDIPHFPTIHDKTDKDLMEQFVGWGLSLADWWVKWFGVKFSITRSIGYSIELYIESSTNKETFIGTSFFSIIIKMIEFIHDHLLEIS